MGKFSITYDVRTLNWSIAVVEKTAFGEKKYTSITRGIKKTKTK